MSRVAVLGVGGIGCGAAALLSENGHAPMLWSPSGRGTAAFADGSALRAGGKLTGRYDLAIAADCAAARAEFRCLKGMDFVEAARCIGAQSRDVLLRQILPNALRSLAMVITLGIGSAILPIEHLIIEIQHLRPTDCIRIAKSQKADHPALWAADADDLGRARGDQICVQTCSPKAIC